MTFEAAPVFVGEMVAEPVTVGIDETLAPVADEAASEMVI